jgi:type IV pilus assembly protein PilV
MTIHAGAAKRLRDGQAGSYLLEALIAILIFAFGVLGLVGLLGSSLRVTNDARFRVEASNLASAMIADMWTRSADQIEAEFGTGGTRLTEVWQPKAEDLLPGAADNPITVNLPLAGLSAQSRTVTVTVYWQMPGESELHRHTMSAEIGKNPLL